MSKYVLQIIAGVILLVILVGVFLLAWHGTIPGGEALAVVTTVIGLVGGAFAVHSGVSAGATAAATPPTTVALHLDQKKLAEAVATHMQGTEARS